MKITFLADEWTQATKGGQSIFNRQLAIELARQPNVEVSILIPKCSPADKNDAETHNIKVFEPEECPGVEPVGWLAFPPEGFSTDFIIGHDIQFGGQGHLIKKRYGCQWIHMVHSNAEETAMFENYPGAISKGQERHETEVKLCKSADMVVTVGSKLNESFKAALHHCKKDIPVFNFIPGILDEFYNEHREFKNSRNFKILVFGRGNTEDFELKGFHVAAKAVADLNDRTYILKVVGAPEGKQDGLAEQLLSHGISRNQLIVRSFYKERKKLAELFCEVDLVLMPSGTEAFGLTALEALSAGLPVLITHNSGLAEALEKVALGSNCIVDPEADWAEAIKKVRKNLETRLEEANDLRERYKKKYCWKDQCAALVEKLESMCSGRVGEMQWESKDKKDSSSPARKRLAELAEDTQGDSQNKEDISYPTQKRKKGSSGELELDEENQRETEKCSLTKKPKLDPLESGTAVSSSGSTSKVEQGILTDDELETLGREIGRKWSVLGRRLQITDSELEEIEDKYKDLSQKGYQMLKLWKQREGTANKKTLYVALTHKHVQRKDLAEKYCRE